MEPRLENVMRFVILPIVLAILMLSGCSRLRFVIDAVPAQDDLTETVVMADKGAGAGSKVALIDVTGLIMDAPTPGLLMPGENPVSRFAESLRLAADDASVKAVIVRINSPGGTVTASDVMYRELKHFKQETGKPVVISMADVAASGGYYLACAGDEIVAYPTTVTGSIGVIMQTFNFSDGMKKIGIKSDAITSGPNKAVGSPFEPMPAEHRELLQGLVTEFYGNFRGIVTSNRTALSPNDIDWITDGRVVTGKRAAEVGLVDKVGDLRDAFAAAKTRANLTSAQLVKYHRPLDHVGSAWADAPAPPASQINLMQLNVAAGAAAGGGANFWYLWDPAVW
jgi:protease IV